MDDTATQPVQEGEIVSQEQPTPQTTPPTFDINAYNATLEIVRRRIGILEKAKEELQKLKEMHNDIFVNDPAYVEADKLVKEEVKKRKNIQARLNKQPNAVDLNQKITSLKEEIKSNEETLSQELMEYYKVSGVTEIEDEQGNVQEFTIKVKLKPRTRTE